MPLPYIQGVLEKSTQLENFTKVRCPRYLQELSVSLCTLTFSGTSSTKIILNASVFKIGKNLPEKALRTNMFHRKQILITQIPNLSIYWTVLIILILITFISHYFKIIQIQKVQIDLQMDRKYT